MTDTQLAPVPTLAQQIDGAATVLDAKKKPTDAERATFRALIKQEPGQWRRYGDLAYQAQLHVLRAVNMPEAMRESLDVGMKEMRRELAGDDAPRMLALLAEHAVMCWLRLAVTEYAYTSNLHESKDGYTYAKGDFWERRLSMAQGRYLRALATLAQVQKLAVPVQINIAAAGGQQVNIAGPA